MSASWGRNWRKIYQTPSRDWMTLPVSARGLGYELIRVVDEDGRMALGGQSAVRVVALAVGALPRERRRIAEDFEALLRDGFCAVVGDHLVIRNFVVAQKSVGPSGERMRALRERRTDDGAATEPRRSRDGAATNAEQPNGATPRNDSGEPVTVTAPRQEETRRDQTPPSGASGACAPAREGDPPDRPRLPDRERLTPAAGDEFLLALAAGGADVQQSATGSILAALGRLLAELGLGVAEATAMGRRLRTDPPPFWAGKRINAALLVARDGEQLMRLRDECAEKPRAPPAKARAGAADLRAAERAWGGIKVGDEIDDPLTGGRLVVGGGGTA